MTQKMATNNLSCHPTIKVVRWLHMKWRQLRAARKIVLH